MGKREGRELGLPQQLKEPSQRVVNAEVGLTLSWSEKATGHTPRLPLEGPAPVRVTPAAVSPSCPWERSSHLAPSPTERMEV